MTWRPHSVFSASAALLMTVSCGGGSTPTAPPSPVPDTPCQAQTAAAGPLRPIINGTACDATVSSVVMLRMRYDGSGASSLCSGTVITPHVVLTAAHCLVQNPLDVTVVRGGTSDIVSRSYVVHPGYRAERYPLDVALVKTDQDLGRAAVPLLISRAAVIGERALLAGWGKDQAGSVGTLRAGSAAVDFVGETYLTTRNNEQTGMLCSGDSGGPLLLSHNGSWMLAGVAYQSIYTGANTPLCESGISVYAGTHTAAIASFLRAEAADALFR